MNHYSLLIDDSEVEDVDSLPDMSELSICEQARRYPPAGWKNVFANADSALERISSRLETRGHYYPTPEKYLFHIFRICPLSRVKVVIIGQDPYPSAENAFGIAFSTPPRGRIPASLNNIFKELEQEYFDFDRPKDGCLLPWVDQGVFLLNYCLTYHPEKPLTTAELNVWMGFTSKVIDAICEANPRAIFVLWGKKAENLQSRIKSCKILTGAHPSPQSWGFLGCNHFRQINEELVATGQIPIDWRLC